MDEKLAYYLNKMNKVTKYNSKNVDEEIMEYDSDEYILLLILCNCYEIYKLRKLPEPQFEKKNNLYRFFTKELQIVYHKTKKIDKTMIDPKIKKIISIEQKDFKQNGPDKLVQEGFDVTYIPWNQMILPFDYPQVLNIEVLDEFQLYEGVDFDNRSMVILHTDPLVKKLGAKKGQVIRFDILVPDKLSYVEIHYRKVAEQQVKIKEVMDDDDENFDEPDIATGLGEDEERSEIQIDQDEVDVEV